MGILFNLKSRGELFEHRGFGAFEGSLPYTDWSDFGEKLRKVIKKGFTDEADLISKMGMDKAVYDKVVNNMIYNWKDSVSKSLLHAVAEIGNKLPKAGTNIFKDLASQTKFLIIAGPGFRARDIYGGENSVDGLKLISPVSTRRIRKKNPKDADDRFVNVGGAYALTLASDDTAEQKKFDRDALGEVNKILQYIWLYAFYNHHKLKKDKSVSKKLPKYIYRGIRGLFGDKDEINKILADVGQKKSEDGKYNMRISLGNTKERYDKVVEYIIAHGLSKITDGKLLSFTAAKPIANYFANHEGMIIRVDPSKVDVVSSELTEPRFKEADYVSGKKEREYIIRIPKNYKFTKDDIEIVNLDYLMADNNPLAVAHFNHDNVQAVYKMHGWTIRAQWYWRTNERGSIVFSAEKKGEREIYSEGRLNAKKVLGFDPMPTEENLKDIKDFKLRRNKSSYGSDWEDL